MESMNTVTLSVASHEAVTRRALAAFEGREQGRTHRSRRRKPPTHRRCHRAIIRDGTIGMGGAVRARAALKAADSSGTTQLE
jgi:hypothetical protein